MISVSVCVKHCDWERDPRLPVVRRESSRGARSGRCVGSAVPVPGLYLRYNNIMLNNNVSFIVFSIQLYSTVILSAWGYVHARRPSPEGATPLGARSLSLVCRVRVSRDTQSRSHSSDRHCLAATSDSD